MMKKTVLAMVLSAAMVLTLSVGCGSGSSSSGSTAAVDSAADSTAAGSAAVDSTAASTATDSTASGSTATDSATASSADSTAPDSAVATSDTAGADTTPATGSYTIGISQFAEHASLDNCREGFLDGLEESGIEEGKNLTVLYDNAQADTGTASTVADNYVSKKVDMICAIATPSAMAAYNSVQGKDIPVVYTAVSDPVSAGLAKEDKSPVGDATGTSDTLPVTAQLEMIRKLMPDAKTIGILYTTSEANSVSTIEAYKKSAGDYGFTIVESGISTIADVDLAAKDLVEKVDCISNLTDNTVVSALQTVLSAANAKSIPVFGSEVEQVKAGCVASMGIDYEDLGEQTGIMAAKILKGEAKASGLDYEIFTNPNLYVNTAAAAKINMKLDETYIQTADETFDDIEIETGDND